ncbi:MAG: hypothetical protein ACRDKS_10230 [Actinomycetota bacterium]
MARSLGLLLVLVIVAFIVWSFSKVAKGVATGRRARRKPGSYDFDSRYNRTYRKVKGVKGPAEDHEGITAFIESRPGVEAYLEPKTVAHPLSVVLVAQDGEWKRFELAEDAFIRRLSSERGLPVYDAARVGYPQRMREYRRPKPPEDPGPQPT